MTDETQSNVIAWPGRGVAAPRRNLVEPLEIQAALMAAAHRKEAAFDRARADACALDYPDLAAAYDILAAAREGLAAVLDGP
ncbi:hypothetical protein L2U69_11930 [Zavarzinia compransoris]|uniref:hypothetical protein n=1 Tax=Zavarzinia marina TaxID=2911065 RepID=UPI001F319A4B|nr:hypothetical protein [Zavarzinia marina]MCF4166356.1 hypothetical protein [Zavarzinia marina]